MGVLFGAAYYAEYHQSSGPERLQNPERLQSPEWRQRVERDLDLMQQAGFTVIRVGESVWSTWEPREGEFDLEWLLPVVDGAHRRGIGVILGTPTYAVPPWLQQAYPEIAAEKADGRAIAWGGRQEVDYSHPAFRFHAERVIRAVIARYAEHPAVIGYQVDNEPGLELFHNHGAFTRFVRRLKQQYGDVATLNAEWGLTYWSHRIADWSELWRPEGNTLPQYDLAWRRYQSDLTTEFIAWQADLVREYAQPDQFVMTCISYPRPAADDHALAAVLDVTAGNPYYAMQDRLDATKDLPALSNWTTSGVAGLFRQADRLYSSRQDRFLVTETNAQSIDGSWNNRTPWPGQLRQAAFALISRGASMIEYWHWHTLPYGTETYWGGVLPHSLEPGRVYQEVAGIGAELREISDGLDGFVPDTDVTLLWSNESNWALQFFPPLSTEHGEPDPASYERIFDAFHRGVVDAGAQARILHLAQAIALGAQALAAQHPVLIVPALYVAADADLELLREYAAAGGHLVLGIRTGYGDHEARARVSTAPAILAEPAGVHYSEYSNIDAPVPVTGTLAVPEGAAATGWIDGLIADGAETLAGYVHPRFRDFPAVVTKEHGAGRITTIGTVPNPALAAAIVRWVAPSPVADEILPDRALPITVSSGRLPDGGRAWFLFNWSWDEQTVTTSAGATITLEPWGTHRIRTTPSPAAT